MQINQTTLSALFRGYRTIFLEAMHGAQPMWSQIAMRSPSSAAEELYHWLAAIPGMKELTGEMIIENFAGFNYTIRNKEWYDTVGVRQADIERDSYGIYNPRFQALGAAAQEHPDELLSNLLINGFTTLDYTGKNFFDSVKSRGAKDAAPFTNKSTLKLSAANFDIARTALKSVLNAKGRPMNLGRKLLLIVAPQNETTARQILQADFIAQTAQNVAKTENVASAAVTNVFKGTADLLVWPRLAANPNYWFVLEVGMAVRPLIVQIEKDATLTSLDSMTSDHVFLNHEFLYQAYGRYNVGYGLSDLAWGSNGTTGP